MGTKGKDKYKRALRVTIALGAAILLASALIYVVEETNLDSVTEREVHRVRATVLVAADLDRVLEGLAVSAEAIAAQIEPWGGSPEETGRARGKLDDALEIVPQFGGAYIVAPDRRVISASSSRVGILGLTRSGTHIDEAIAGRTGVSETFDPLSRQESLAVAVPIGVGDGAGVLIVESSLSRVSDVVAAAEGAGLVRVLALAPSGGAIDVHPFSRSAPDAETPRKRLGVETEPGLVEYIGQADVSLVTTYAQSAFGWAVVSTQDAEVFYAGEQTILGRLRTRGRTQAAALAITGLSVSIALLYLLANRRLVEKGRETMQAKTALLSSVGHELRTPLTVIRGGASTLSARWRDVTPEQRDQLLDSVEHHSRSLERLVDKILLGGELAAGLEANARTRSFDLSAKLSESVSYWARSSPLHSFHLTAPESLQVKSDSRIVNQVLDQIFDNAVKYSPDGGQVLVTAKTNGRKVLVTIEDEGIGLPADHETMFDVFGQTETPMNRTYDEGGVGLGLFVSRKLIRQLGGDLRAEARQPRGARFTVFVPTDPDE